MQSLDVSNNIVLETLDIGLTDIQEIDLSKNTKLKMFIADGNKCSRINVTQNRELEHLSIYLGTVSQIDLSQNIALNYLYLEEIKISMLDINNNVQLERLVSVDNTNLFCIEVWDINFAESHADWSKEDFTSYSFDCARSDADGVVQDEVEISDKMVLLSTITKGEIAINNPNKDEIATVSVAALNGTTIASLPIHDIPREINLNISGNSKVMYIIRITKMSGKDEFIKVILE